MPGPSSNGARGMTAPVATAPGGAGAGSRNERSVTMSFELKPGQSARKNVRRIARKQLDDALEQLTGTVGARDEAVHEVRKSLKKVRAVLRLVRRAIGEATYRAENTCFRDTARPLTEVRDARILIETLDNLIEHFKGHVVGRSFDDVRKAMEANLRAVRKRVLEEQ